MTFHWLISHFHSKFCLLKEVEDWSYIIQVPAMFHVIIYIFLHFFRWPPTLPVPIQYKQWHSVTWLPEIYTHMHTREDTHIYLFPKQNFWEGIWFVILTHHFISKIGNFLFLISEWYKAQFMAEMFPQIWEVEENRNQLNSQAWEGLKEKVITAGTGDSQMYPAKDEHAPCLPCPSPHLQLHL